jgi:hypothetical protein
MALRGAFKRVEVIETAPVSKGKTKLLKYLSGDVLTRGDSIIAKCAECMGYYIDGRYDCEIPLCPLYHYMPYRGKVRPKGEEG